MNNKMYQRITMNNNLGRYVPKMNNKMYQRMYTITMNKSKIPFIAPKKNKYKAIIVGGGHNGLICGKHS